MPRQNLPTHRLAEMATHTRRHFLQQCPVGLGAVALGSLLQSTEAGAARRSERKPESSGAPMFPAKVKNVIYLFMAGGPSQLELFDYKPMLAKYHGQVPPESLMEGKRFAFLKGNETLLRPYRSFKQYGQQGMWLSDLLPHHRHIVDDVCFVRTMATDVFNHGPAKIFINTGSPQPGRPSLGAWVTYGLGSESQSLPGFVVLQSGPRGPRAGALLWSSGFLPTTYQGVPFRSAGDPILNLSTPAGIPTSGQQAFFSAVSDLNRHRLDVVGDPEIATRIAAYEMAYRMQTSAPELMDLQSESAATLRSYGASPGEASFANNCLLARRLVERGVRFVQLYHTNWDHHGGAESLEKDLPLRARQIDQASAALVLDLKQRGLLDETLVIWGGEFGRTPVGELRSPTGRDHHIESFTVWMAGGGVKPGYVHGETDELGFGAARDRVHVHDLQATILHLLGLDHERLTFRFQGRDFRLTDVHGRVVHEILS